MIKASDTSFMILVIVLLGFPLGLGIVSAFTVSKHTANRFLLAMGTGLLFLVGMYAYLRPSAALSDASDARRGEIAECHVCFPGSGGSAFVLYLYLVYCIILMLLSLGVTSLMIKWPKRIKT